MGPIIRAIGTIFYSLVYLNSRIGFNGLKYLYSVISVIDKSLPGNTRKWTFVRSWTARVRLVHPWAGILYIKVYFFPEFHVFGEIQYPSLLQEAKTNLKN